MARRMMAENWEMVSLRPRARTDSWQFQKDIYQTSETASCQVRPGGR